MPLSNSRDAAVGARAVYRRALRQAAALLMVALVPAVGAAFFHPLRPSWGMAAAGSDQVTWAQAQRWSGRVLLVDARGTTAYHRRHIPGALSLDESRWERDLPGIIQAWRPGDRVVVYCDSEACDTSAEVARRLRREMGIDHVYVLKGGWAAWLAAQNR